MQLQNNDAHPLYLQLKSILKNEITSGVYKSGERIPTEAELCKKYNVSRNTVRNAINELVKENLLVRKQGKGTFVTQKKVNRELIRTPIAKGFTQICREMGCQAGAKVIKSVFEDATTEDMEVFNLKPGDKVIVIERIRYVDGVPVSLDISRFPERFEFLLNEDLNDCSMFEILEKKYGIVFSTEYRELELTFATYEQSRYLQLSKGYPLLRLYIIHKDTNNVFSHRSIQYIVGDKFKMII